MTMMNTVPNKHTTDEARIFVLEVNGIREEQIAIGENEAMQQAYDRYYAAGFPDADVVVKFEVNRDAG